MVMVVLGYNAIALVKKRLPEETITMKRDKRLGSWPAF